jgi:hypothetical protein
MTNRNLFSWCCFPFSLCVLIPSVRLVNSMLYNLHPQSCAFDTPRLGALNVLRLFLSCWASNRSERTELIIMSIKSERHAAGDQQRYSNRDTFARPAIKRVHTCNDLFSSQTVVATSYGWFLLVTGEKIRTIICKQLHMYCHCFY